MNRRNFLKRVAAVAAGAVIVPTVKALPFKPDPAQVSIIHRHAGRIKGQYRWVQVYGPYCPGEINAAPVVYLNKVSCIPLHELGAIAITGDGRH